MFWCNVSVVCLCAVCFWVVHVQRQHLQAAGHVVETLPGLGKAHKQPHCCRVESWKYRAQSVKGSRLVTQQARGVNKALMTLHM